MQTVKDFESVPNYADMVADHENDPNWLTAGDHSLTAEEQTHIHDMIVDYKRMHALAEDVEIAEILAT